MTTLFLLAPIVWAILFAAALRLRLTTEPPPEEERGAKRAGALYATRCMEDLLPFEVADRQMDQTHALEIRAGLASGTLRRRDVKRVRQLQNLEKVSLRILYGRGQTRHTGVTPPRKRSI